MPLPIFKEAGQVIDNNQQLGKLDVDLLTKDSDEAMVPLPTEQEIYDLIQQYVVSHEDDYNPGENMYEMRKKLLEAFEIRENQMEKPKYERLLVIMATVLKRNHILQ